MSRRPVFVLAAIAAFCLGGTASAGETAKPQADAAKTASLTVSGCPGGSARSAACLDANKSDTKACACTQSSGDAPAAAGTLDATGGQASKWAPTGKLAPVRPPALATSPAPGARKVNSGTIKLVCPKGTDKLCDGNNCGCWTRNE